MARVLGLDLGSYSVKATLLETSLRGSATRSVTEVKCPLEGDRLGKLRAALTELLAKGPLYADTVVVALPGTSVATHPVTMPFADPKKIEAALAFEVESQLPYDLAEAVYDYQQAVMRYTTAQVTYNTDCCGLSVQYRRYNAGIRDESQIRIAFSIANVGTFGTLRKQDRLF